MASACCPHWPCPCDQLLKSAQFRQETSSEEEEPTDTTCVPTNMDIALLKEQYNSIREKQKRETRVICFAKAASTNEEIAGKSLVNVVPMRQARHPLMRQASVQETQFDFVRDLDNATWRTHLGLYRRACSIPDTNRFQPSNHKNSTGDSTSTDITVHSVEVTDLSDLLSEDCEGYENRNHVCSKMQEDCESEGFRKFSAPAVVARQSSCGSYRSSHTPVSSYYPFPQLKCPKKSEAARRLGLYSSF
ncbi:TBC1 domain family member 30-like [Silurus meridionalis]|uniref:TBC1 domain-containing protein n=1 Tax=Silurus meridionalis TaxID=175797 RepID=A0A8T0BNF6_SILME|nr:TBC1 domain family member 30-like [Silurus meridionalis]KAF7708881.1 hypothetical protein HF521_017938 [Silurus meridionalis]KAI5106507.1 hypothetical protein C0J45_4204 [Silurus meridionalis]